MNVQIFLSLFLIICIACVPDSTRKSSSTELSVRVAFYNVENLFDTIDDPAIDDQEFLPTSEKQWNDQRYQDKLTKVAEVMRALEHPLLVGLAEVENVQVLHDLTATSSLHTYKIIHFDAPDSRGIDVALLYQGSFKPYLARPIAVNLPDNYKTRDILRVSGTLYQDTLHILVNHWPSRVGGLEKTEPNRVAVSTQVRQEVDAIVSNSPAAKIIVMGDFNDEPDNRSIAEVLGAQQSIAGQPTKLVFNPMAKLQADGQGSYNYRGNWDMLDQIILSAGLSQASEGISYHENSATVFSPEWLQQQGGDYDGYPHRTYAGPNYLGGYSDHFPVFIELLVKESVN